MRIAVVHSFYSSTVPSGENAVVDLQCAALRANGHDVELFRASTDDLRRQPFFELRAAARVASGRGNNPLAGIERFHPDVVHVHNLFPNFGSRWLRELEVPFVATVHNYRPICAAATLHRDGARCELCPRSGHHNAVAHRCYKGSAVATLPLALRNAAGTAHNPVFSHAARLVFLSARAAADYHALAGVPGAGTVVIPNFVDVDTVPEAGTVLDRWIFVGRLSEEKGILELLDTWPGSAHLDIFGDGPLRPVVEARASGAITYHGAVDQDVALREIARSTGLVIPSTCAEALPTVYLEALALGVPVVVKEGNSAADDATVSGSGLVFSSFADVPQALARLASDRRVHAEAARRRAQSTFSRECWLERTERLYAGVAASAIGRGAVE